MANTPISLSEGFNTWKDRVKLTEMERTRAELQAATEKRIEDRSELSNLPAYAAPVTELEGQICSAFSLGTGVSPIGLDDDIFDLGGDSLIAEVISIKLSELFERAFAASMFINFGTPRSISNWAEGLKA